MKELTKCSFCGRPLVSYEQVHAVRGGLYCSEKCAKADIKQDVVATAIERAQEIYDTEAEILNTEDILSEDLQEVKIIVSHVTVIKLPKNLSKEEAMKEALDLYHEGLVVAEPDDCSYTDVKCELVEDENSPHTIEFTLEDDGNE